MYLMRDANPRKHTLSDHMYAWWLYSIHATFVIRRRPSVLPTSVMLRAPSKLALTGAMDRWIVNIADGAPSALYEMARAVGITIVLRSTTQQSLVGPCLCNAKPQSRFQADSPDAQPGRSGRNPVAYFFMLRIP